MRLLRERSWLYTDTVNVPGLRDGCAGPRWRDSCPRGRTQLSKIVPWKWTPREVSSPTWWHRSFLTPLKRRTKTIHGQDTTERILGPGGEAEAPLCTAENKTDHTGKVRSATHWPHGPSPRPHHTTPRGLPWACSSSGWTSSPLPSALWLLLGRPHSSS